MTTPDSIATFNNTTRQQLQSYYGNHCTVCLAFLTEAGSEPIYWMRLEQEQIKSVEH
jgi:hypothetical protein